MYSDLTEIVLLSLKVSGTALLFSMLIGVPVGVLIGLNRFRGRRFVAAVMYTGMGFPPVVIGLIVYLLLSRSGPLGSLNLPFIPNLFTPGAMIIAQTIIAFPLVAGFTMAAVMGVDPQLRQQVMALGATPRQAALTVLVEARPGCDRRDRGRIWQHHLGGGGGDAGRRQHRRANTRADYVDRAGNPPGQLRSGPGPGRDLAHDHLHSQSDHDAAARQEFRLMTGPGDPRPAQDENIYRIPRLSKDYGGRRVLDLEGLNIRRGEILALVGPSGSGKSTLLRLLNFLEAPSGGEIEFAGVSFASGQELPLALRRRVTTVFQRPMLLDRNVWENVAFGLRLRRQNDDRQSIQNVLEEVGLAQLAQQRARTLSGGEAQRVALARAMVIRPAVLLLDEPTANLDPYNVGLIEMIVKRLNQEQHTTLVLVTHNVFQAHRLADRVAFLLDGKVVEIADTEQFFEAPRDARTRAFVKGEMVY